MELEIRHVRMLLVLAEELHFSRAAARLGVPQSALSQQLTRIEKALGARLFERTTRAVTLTEAGRRKLEDARAADAAMRSFTQPAASGSGPAETLRIATGSPRTGQLAEHIQETFPRLAVRHSAILEDIAAAALDRGDLDVLTGVECPNRPFSFASHVRVATIAEEPVWIILPAGHCLAGSPPVRLADLAREVWVEYPEGTVEHDFLLTICGEVGFTPDIRHLTTDREVFRDLLLCNSCIAVSAPGAQGYEGCRILPLDPVIMRRLVLAWNPDRCPDQVTETITAYVRRFYRDQARKNPAYWDEITANPHRYRYLYPLDESAQ